MFEELHTPYGDQKWMWFGVQVLPLALAQNACPDRAVLSWDACYKSVLHTEINMSDNAGLGLKL